MRAALVDVLSDLAGGVVGVIIIGNHRVVLGVFQSRQSIQAVVGVGCRHAVRQSPRSQLARGIANITGCQIRTVGNLRQVIQKRSQLG